MRAWSATWSIPVVLSGFLALAPAQEESVATGEPAPLRVEIIGASVSAGFVDGPLAGGSPDNRSVPLQRVISGWLASARVGSRADMWMFQDAEGRGAVQVERTLKREPDLVLAVDFLFWFGYGRIGAPADQEGQVRRQRLQVGMDLLERFPCPVVVGDLPDVHGADPRMIQRSQMPSVEVLAELNAAIETWAAGRDTIHLFPLREVVATMKERGIALPLSDGAVATPPGSLMQGDRLHATRVGMAYLGSLMQSRIAGALPPARAGALPHFTFEQFVTAARAESDLETLLGAGAASAPPGDPPKATGGN